MPAQITGTGPAPQLTGSRLGWVYLLSCAGTVLYLLFSAEDAGFDDWLAFSLLAAATLTPGLLWCLNPTRYGFPLWPAITIPAFTAYAIPLVSGQSNVLVYAPELRMAAAGWLSMHFVLGTFVWMQLARRSLPRTRVIAKLRYVDDPRSPVVLTIPALLFELNQSFAWINFAELYPIIRTVSMGLFLIGAYLFGSNTGRRSHGPARVLFWLVFWLYGLMSLLSLYLLPMASALMVMLVALVVGQQRIPWRLLIFAGSLIGLLQEGKGDMRAEVARFGARTSTLAEISDFMTQWVDFSWRRITTGHAYYQRAEQYTSALDRVNLLHLTIRTINEAPERVPYLWGQTYAQIPSVLAPRFLVPDKPWSLVGTHMLNIHYGIQTADQVYDTTIGWGLINESHANFGVIGMGVLGALLGALTGSLGRLTRGLPANSIHVLFAFALVPLLTNTEMTSTVLAVTLFQQVVVFTGLFLLFTRRERIGHAGRTDQA